MNIAYILYPFLLAFTWFLLYSKPAVGLLCLRFAAVLCKAE